MKFEADRDNSYLMHHGVPGQQWGVITKEYEKKGYADRYKNTRFDYQTRQKQAKARREREYRERHDSGRRNGQKVASNFFVETRKRRAAREEARNPVREPDLVDRTVKKAADHLGLSEYSSLASEYLKKEAKERGIAFLKSEKGRKFLANPAGYVGRLGVFATDKVYEMIYKGGAIHTAWKGVKFLGSNSWKATKASALWVHNNGQRVARGAKAAAKFGQDSMRKISGFLSGTAKSGQNWLLQKMSNDYVRKAVDVSKQISRTGSGLASRGAQYALRGAKGLSTLLQKIVRRRS